MSGSFTGIAPATYDVQIRDAAQPTCIITLDGALDITEPAALSATVSLTMVTCNGANDGVITVSSPAGGYGNYQYSLNGMTWQGSGTFSGVAPATYNVSIRDAVNTSCVMPLGAYMITEPATLAAVISSTNVTCYGGNDGTITISSPNGRIRHISVHN